MDKRRRLGGRDLRALRQATEELHTCDRDFRQTANFDFLLYVLMLILVTLAFRTFLFQPIWVDGESMKATLADKEMIIVDKTRYMYTLPVRGDIVICYYPQEPESRVKRVVAIAGDTIEIRDGAVYINTMLINESEYWRGSIERDMPPCQVPWGHVFVMGDNRNFSADSRDENVGFIPLERISGRANYVLLPLPQRRVVISKNFYV